MAEYNGEVIPLDNEPVGAKPYIGEVTPLKNVSTSEALGRGVESGLTAGFGDELKGLYAAGAPAESSPKQEPSTLEKIANLGTTRETALLQTLKGAYNYLTGAPEAEKKYEETKTKENQAFEEAKKQHPIATMIGEVGGSVPTTMLLPGGTAATAGKLGQRMLRGAQVGAEYGAIQGAGEGEGLEGRLTGAGVGALTGGVGGAAAPAVVTGVSKLVANPLQKVVSVVKGWRFPEAEAAKRVASALAKDEADIVAGNAQGMTRSDWVKARDAGEPVTIADLGASNTQALLRSAANTSPEARNILEKVIYERFEGQSERVSRDIRQLVSGGANRFKTADQLEAEYRVAANPAYKEAYAHPNAQSMWDSTIANLARAPVVQDAIKLATKEAENEAVRVGASPIRHPFKIDQNGNLSIADPNMKPNLAFWDIVKQNLDDKVSALYRSGEKNAGNRAKDIKNDFLSHLDDLVPDYKKARGVAADYFNASNALEAGSKAANTKVVPEEISKLMRSMRPEERDLFREGYASSWSEKIMNMPYGTNVATRILPGPKERRMAEIIFGVDNIAKIETRVDLERIMNGTRAALGNSTTARQLIEAGLAGGAGAGIGYEGGGGWGAAAGAVSGAAGARHQAGKAISKGLEYTAKWVDRGTARRVAEMLVSDDPNVLGEGLRIASRNRNIAEGLKSIADRLGVIAAEKASSGIQPRIIPQITIHKEPPRATGGSVFDKMHAAKHMQEGGGLSSFLEGEYSGNKEGQHGGGYLGIESPTGNAGIGGRGWRENTPEGRLGRASITNVDVGHKIGDLNLTGSYRANQREIARPPAGDNTYFDPIEHSGQKFRMPNDIDKRFMLRLSKPFSDGGSVFDKMHAAKHMAEGGGLESFIKSLGSQGAAFGTQTEGEQAGHQRDPISELGKGAYNAVEHLAKENIDNANLLATGNRDQFSGKPGFEAGMLTMGTGAVAGVPMRAGEAVLGAGPIRAYHGSPHDFDKFDLAKIGTGEGAQSYGHGLYFAENPKVAETYKAPAGVIAKAPQGWVQDTASNFISEHGKEGAQKVLTDLMSKSPEMKATFSDVLAAVKNSKPLGKMYEVELNANPEHFLDWDKPIGQQPQALQDLVANGPPRWGENDFVRGQLTAPDGQSIYKRIATDSIGKQGYGADHNAYAADVVSKAGIPGIKYLDQGSRAAGEGSRNYVVFDPNIIEIMKKYGMTLPAATAAYEAMKSNQEKTGFKKGGSVFDKMHMARKRAEGGGTDAPFNEWDAVPRNAEGIPQIRIEKPPVNEADEAQAAREAAAARIAGNVRGAPYEPTPPSTEGKTWMMEPGKEAVQSGNYENTLPPNVRLDDADLPYNVETGEKLQMVRRPSNLPWTRTPDGVRWAMPKIAELAGDIVNPLAVTKGVALKPGEFALGSGPIKRSVLEQPNAPTFYSALDRAVADIPQAKAPAEQWAATLANRPGVKPEEIQWRGLDQYLAGRQGQTVTKQEIAHHLAGNKVELGQVVKSEYRPGDVNESKYYAALDIHANALYGEPYDGLLASQQSEVRGVTLKDQNINPTKFSSYQLPGGENYSEKLLTLPYERQIKWEKTPEGHLTGGGYTIKHEPFQDQPAYITYYGNDGRRVSGNDSLKGAQNLIERSSRGVDASKAYKSPHWDEPNPVTHMRTNERTIGNTSSHHIEEVQSDWHQKGRRRGYQTEKPLTADEETRFAELFHKGMFGYPTKEEIAETKELYNRKRDYEVNKNTKVPDAPFKTTWPDLTMKQALRDAVEGGKDRLSWTPGEAQALRYPDELRKLVSSIEWHNMKSGKPNPTGEKQILVEHKQGGGQTEFTVNKDGIVTAGPGQAVGKPINEVIGKDMSRQIMEQPHGTIDGKDFVMGAHGMTEFYDKMLPKAVEKLGKAYGVKVQRGVDTTGNPVNYVDIPPAWKQEILKKGFPLFASGGSVFDKMKRASK